MSENNAAFEESKQARDIKGKFDFYVLALTFTILGLSIETADFNGSSLNDVFELSSWLFLLMSGLAGLSRLEWLPNIYALNSEVLSRRNRIMEMHEAKQKSVNEIYVVASKKTISIEEDIKVTEKAMQDLQGIIDQLAPKSERKYNIQKFSFIAGLCFVILSRAFIPFSQLVQKMASVMPCG